LVAVSVLAGCATGPDLRPPSGVIGGHAAPASVIVVDAEQTFKAPGGTCVLPAGRYRPAFEDPAGVYYEAPSKAIFYDESLFGIRMPAKPFTGGIYLQRSSPTVPLIYGMHGNEGGEIQRMLKAGRPNPPQLPKEPIRFRLVHNSAQ